MPFLRKWTIDCSIRFKDSPARHVDAKWVSVGKLDQYDWAPADIPIVEQLKAVDIWD